jgi:membrane protein implicated in regulation of membrane protease activity
MSVPAEGFGLLNQVFLVCAVVGGAVFIIKMALMLIGGHVDVHTDMDMSGDVHLDSDASAHLVSIQGIVGLVMMFGLVGLLLNYALRINALLALLGASAAGAATLYGTAKMMGWMMSLQSSGTIDEKNALGAEGVVYLHIPPDGVGKVHVTIQNRLMEYEAESQNHTELKTGEQVRVVFIKGNNLVVEKI